MCLSLYLILQPLEAIDVANAVVYVLSAPPHVQVIGFSLFTYFIYKVLCFTFVLTTVLSEFSHCFHLVFQVGDIVLRPVEQQA